ncbi:MAG: DNA-directed RNA polymerase subunit beta' [Anaerolineae bacterium]|nr:DNA-directed RNA polymerase subunit beta' [Anaerolineae bacterium]
MHYPDDSVEFQNFVSLRISLASPEEIRNWSYGEITKPETINYRRLRPEKDGLFCEAIFGPTRDWQCYCGKYKNIRYRGIICDKCGVEVTRTSVRRERMGHIELAAPVAHIWYTRRTPSFLGILLDIPRRQLDRVLYFAQYVITAVDEDARQKAAKRLKEEYDQRKQEVESVVQETIASLDERLEEEKTGIEAKIAESKAAFEERLNGETEALMKEVQKLRKRLEDQQGSTPRAPIILKPIGSVIVDKGETIGREHLVMLNQVVQEELEQIENRLKAEQEQELGTSHADLKHWQEATAAEISHINENLAQEMAKIDAAYNDEREELFGLDQMQFVTEHRLRELKSRWGQVFRAAMGAEAFYEILRRMDMDKLAVELWHQVRHDRSKQRRKKATRRLQVVEALKKSNNRPEWMILTVLPVIPPDLRPMVQLDGGRFATSDLNDLYRRVINRNNRLKRLVELGAPDVIIRNEKRMLQEAVDSLIDNSQRGKALSRRGRRQLKSLSDMLKGKKGRFRRNLLGKRVDYSGRSVIVIGPKLKLYQCGLPKEMALELYRPFVISKLVEYNYASNVKAAKRIIERHRQEVWEVLEEVIQDRPVLLNRAPTLHRLGIQAFEPVLVEGKAIQIHPLVCSAFNADFDGDQMAVHIPLSLKAVEEARKLMLASRNLLKPADGQPIVGPTKDMCLGVYYLTMETDIPHRGDGKVFSNPDELEMAYSLGHVDLHARIKLGDYKPDAAPGEMIDTTVGRCLFNRILPEELRFVDATLDRRGLQDLVAVCYRRLGEDPTTEFVDQIKRIGFHYATRSGVTIAIADLAIPAEKEEILDEANAKVAEVDRQYRRGLLTADEQYARTIDLWSRAREEVSDAVARNLDPGGPVAVMAQSGASKGGFGPISQLAGMRGLMADPSGRIIPLPILSNLREGHSALEYFISTHGSRKGLADTALRTADAGYLTRRLVDVAQDMIVNAHDCGTHSGIWIHRQDDIGGQTMRERLTGRVAAAAVVHPKTGEVIVDRNEELGEPILDQIDDLNVEDVLVRSPMTCSMQRGICALCYGRDLGRGEMVHIGAAVGVMAAQSIGEPGTQLTLRTFHTGGIAAGGDITSGLPRVEELFEARKHPRGEAEISDIDGIVHITRSDGLKKVRIVKSEVLTDKYSIPGNWGIKVEDGDEIDAGTLIASRGDQEVVARHGGTVRRDDRDIRVVYERREEREYEVPSATRLLVAEGQVLKAGDQIYEGVQNPHRILQVMGWEATRSYILSEIQKVYRSQGVNINDKHFEIIIRKMLGKMQLLSSGDTDLLPGDLVDRLALEEINRHAIMEGGQPAKGRAVLLGITKAALNTESFLSAASFQHTIKVLSRAAIEGQVDQLYGLKENVIIGKLIPAGTGYRGDNPESDGPIYSFEGVEMHLPEPADSGVLPAGSLPLDDEEMAKLLGSGEIAEPLDDEMAELLEDEMTEPLDDKMAELLEDDEMAELLEDDEMAELLEDDEMAEIEEMEAGEE